MPLLAAGTMKCWGYNLYGQIGDNTTTERHLPTTVTGLSGVAEMTVGSDHTCTQAAAGTVKCWGLNDDGQLGDNTVIQRHVPTAVSGLTGVAATVGGGLHTCAPVGHRNHPVLG